MFKRYDINWVTCDKNTMCFTGIFQYHIKRLTTRSHIELKAQDLSQKEEALYYSLPMRLYLFSHKASDNQFSPKPRYKSQEWFLFNNLIEKNIRMVRCVTGQEMVSAWWTQLERQTVQTDDDEFAVVWSVNKNRLNRLLNDMRRLG